MSEPQTKICIKCGQEKDASLFLKDRNVCKECNKIRRKKYYEEHKDQELAQHKRWCEDHKEDLKGYGKQYRAEHKEERIEYQKQYNEDHKEGIKEQQKHYRKEHNEEIEKYNKQYEEEHKEEKSEYNKQYREEHKEEIKEYEKQYKQDHKKERNLRDKKRREDEPAYKLRSDISKSFREQLKKVGIGKNGRSSMEYFEDDHLLKVVSQLKYQWTIPENLTPDGKVWMTWDNWTVYVPKTWDDNDPSTWTWQLDHIVPQSDFDFSNEEEIKKCWALENLRPLSAKQNVLDGVNRTRHKKK